MSGPSLVKGISAHSRSQSYAKRALFKQPKAKAAVPAAAAAPTTVTKTIGGAKNGKTRTITLATSADATTAYGVKLPKRSRKRPAAPTTRSSITPGTVLILLGGRFRGKRVVYLRTLASGLLLVTGPHKLNGVPLKRVNQAFVIATSTHLDIGNVKVPSTIDDAYFARSRAASGKPTAQALFDGAAAPKSIDAHRIKDQKAVDTQLLPLIKKVPLLRKYLNASFALSKGQYPHAIKF